VKEYKKPKKHEQYLSSNPHGHYAARSTPAKSPSGIRYNIPTGRNEQWMDDMRIDIFDTLRRHHHIHFRQSIEAHNDMVREYYQRQNGQERHYGLPPGFLKGE